MYCTHVNNIAYLLDNHRTTAKDMNHIVESLTREERKKYDYDVLEEKYLEYCSHSIEDEEALMHLSASIGKHPVLLLFPGKSVVEKYERIQNYIAEKNPVVIGVNAITKGYDYTYLFFANPARYAYAGDVHQNTFRMTKKIIASNIKTRQEEGEWIVNFDQLIKRGWEHFDNAGLMCLRLMSRLHVHEVAIAGFDGFSDSYEESYADIMLPHIDPRKKWSELNEEIRDMLTDFRAAIKDSMEIRFLTESIYETC